jgi:light-regulated signal transduction histidine kinase (bacteriophytochrome)
VLNSSPNVIQSFESIRDENNSIIDFRLIQANETSQKLLQRNVSTIIGKTLHEIFSEQQFDHFFGQFRQVVEKGISHDTEYEATLNGTRHWYHATAVKLRDGFTLTIQDISEAKKSAIDLKSNIEALQRSNSELEQFAYVASHDLQEPLRKILTFIDLLKLKSDIAQSAEAENYLQRISNAAMRMRGLISDLLSYSRTGSLQFESTSVNLNVLIQEVLSDLEVFIQQKSAIITFQQLPLMEGMKVQLYQLFQNLISNSLKFATEGRPPVISIENEYVSDPASITPATGADRAFCRITFTDNGIGFDEKYKDKIFQIFQRLHGRSKYDGTGIGLAICKKIVEIHSGTIVAKGYPGKGAIFIVTLPLKQKKYRIT